MFLEERMALAAKKLAGADLRKAGIPDLAAFEPHKLEWGDINKRQKDLGNVARKLIDQMSDGDSEAQVREREAAHEAIMAGWDACEAEKDIRKQIGNRAPRATGHNPNIPTPSTATARGQDGGHVHEDRAEVAVGLRPEQRMTDWARDRGVEAHNLTLGRYLRSMVLGGQDDVERRALAEGTDSAGGYTVPDILSANLIDLLRARTVAIRAGARTIPLTSDQHYIAKVASDPVPAWRAENAAVNESDPTFGRVSLVPRSLAVMVRISRELLEDSLNLETALPMVIASAMAVELDRVAFFGTGTAPQPRGIVNTTGVNEVALNAALAGYGPMVQARTKVLEANANDVTAYAMSPRDDGDFAELSDTTGQPLRMPKAIENVPFLTSTSFPTDGGVGTDESTIVTGHFPHLIIGIRNQIRVEILKERYADVMQYAFIGHLRADVAVEHAAAFTKITGVQG